MKKGDDKEQQVDEEVAEAVEVVRVTIGENSNEESLYDEFSKIIPSPGTSQLSSLYQTQLRTKF